MNYKKQLRTVEKLNHCHASTFAILAPMLARSGHSDIRIEIAALASNYPSENSKNMLIRFMQDRDWLVRCNACESMFWYSEDAVAAAHLKDKIRYDKHPMVRAYALLSLFNFSKECKNVNCYKLFLKNLLSYERSIFVKINIYALLYEMGCCKALYRLLANLNHPNYRVRCSVCNTLLELIHTKNKNFIIKMVACRKAKGDFVACMSLYDKIVSN